ncbi:hypothetical protein BH10PSE17_BH10PSE17_24970 [soil metagenome]
MIITTARPLRLNGQPSRHQATYLGTIETRAETDPVTKREMKVLHLTRPGRGDPIDLLPPLMDATLVAVRGQGFVFRGLEQLGDGAVAQSWMVEYHDAVPEGARR